MTRIAIIGAGAIGSALGAMLCRAGQDVTLIARSAHVGAIRRHGLQVDGAMGSFTVQVAIAEKLTFRPDFVFLTVKTQDVLAALHENMAMITGVPLVTFQNGVRSDELVATLIPQEQIISAVVNIHANYLTPGAVTVIYPGPLVVGRPFGTHDDRVDAVAAILRHAVVTTVSRNIHGVHWLKLISNLNNAFPALTNMTFQQIYAEPYLRQLAVHVMREGLHVAKRANIRLESLPDTPAILLRLVAWLPPRLAGAAIASKMRRMETTWPLLGSTLQSLRRRRPTEIDYLNGEVVRVGRQRGIPTPLNEIVVELVHRTEQAEQFWTVDAIRSAVNAAAPRGAGEWSGAE